jgi:hypothetical protein
VFSPVILKRPMPDARRRRGICAEPEIPGPLFNTSVIAAGGWGYLAVGDRTTAALFYEEASSQIDSGRTKTPFLVAHAHPVGGSI